MKITEKIHKNKTKQDNNCAKNLSGAKIVPSVDLIKQKQSLRLPAVCFITAVLPEHQ